MVRNARFVATLFRVAARRHTSQIWSAEAYRLARKRESDTEADESGAHHCINPSAGAPVGFGQKPSKIEGSWTVVILDGGALSTPPQFAIRKYPRVAPSFPFAMVDDQLAWSGYFSMAPDS